MDQEKKIRITGRIERNTKEKLQKLADEEDRSISYYIRKGLREILKKKES